MNFYINYLKKINKQNILDRTAAFFRHIDSYLNNVDMNNVASFYVITHERSGTHLLINLLLKNCHFKQGHFFRLGYNNIGEWFGPYDSKENKFEHIDSYNKNWKINEKHTTIIKSHCDYNLFKNRFIKKKVIYVLRDPRDCLLSFYNYLNNDKYYYYNPNVEDFKTSSFSEFLHKPLSDHLKYNFSYDSKFTNVVERWASHVSGWINSDYALIINYKNLINNFENSIITIAKYLNLRLRSEIEKVDINKYRSHLPHKGVIGNAKNIISVKDEQFIRTIVENYGIRWDEVI